MKLPLETKRNPNMNYVFIFKSCKPFVNNTHGQLVHRPRQVSVHKLAQYGPHLAIHYYCGNVACGTDKFEFLDAPPNDRFVCAICEANAVSFGMPSSDEITGYHVHVGRVFAKQACCNTIEAL